MHSSVEINNTSKLLNYALTSDISKRSRSIEKAQLLEKIVEAFSNCEHCKNKVKSELPAHNFSGQKPNVLRYPRI